MNWSNMAFLDKVVTLFLVCAVRVFAISCEERDGYQVFHNLEVGLRLCCKTVECHPGQEKVLCDKHYGQNLCHDCPAGQAQPDFLGHGVFASCWTLDCPEHTREVNGKCECDNSEGYWGSEYLSCNYKKCRQGTQLNKWGYCLQPGHKVITVLKTTNSPPTAPGKTPQKIIPIGSDKNDTGRIPKFSTASSGNVTTAPSSINETGSPNDSSLETGKDYGLIIGVSLGALVLSCLLTCIGCKLRKKWKQYKLNAARESNSNNSLVTTPFLDKNNRVAEQTANNHLFSKPNPPSAYICLELKHLVGKSAGLIHCGDKLLGSGALVGRTGEYVLTSLHVIVKGLGLAFGYPDMTLAGAIKSRMLTLLQRHTIDKKFEVISVCFNYVRHLPTEDRQGFYFLAEVPFLSQELDIIVLKLNQSAGSVVNSLICFGDIDTGDTIDVYGHSNYQPKQVDQECLMRCISPSEVSNLRKELDGYLRSKGLDSFVDKQDVYSNLLKEYNYALDTRFQHGGSGSICVVAISENSYKAVGVFLGGEPYFVWDDEFPSPVRDEMDHKLKVEFCVKMCYVYKAIKIGNSALRSEIFETYPPQWDW